MKLKPQPLTTSIGAVTSRRALRADGSVRVHQYKTFRVTGRDGKPTTLDVPLDHVYAWLRTYRVSVQEVGRLLRDAALLLRRSPPTASGPYLSWSVLVRKRAEKLMQVMTAGVPPEDVAFAEQNNALWQAALEPTEEETK